VVVAMGAAAEFTGARVLLFPSTKRRSETMRRWRSNPRAHLDGLPEAKWSRDGLAAMESFGEIQIAKRGRLGLGFCNLDAKGGCGVGEKLYRAQKGKKISKVSGFGRLSSGRFVPN